MSLCDKFEVFFRALPERPEKLPLYMYFQHLTCMLLSFTTKPSKLAGNIGNTCQSFKRIFDRICHISHLKMQCDMS